MGQCFDAKHLDVSGPLSDSNKSEIEMLMDLDGEQVMLFSLDGRVVAAKIVSVYDGDTCFAVFRMGDEFVKFRLRIKGYDSPEMKPPLNQVNREKEKEDAQKAKKELERLVLNKVVTLHCGKWDKYGRLLGRIIVDGIDVNQHMISHGYGYAYSGTKKEIAANAPPINT
jgi:endonuclease YncB( thermonuclease family)